MSAEAPPDEGVSGILADMQTQHLANQAQQTEQAAAPPPAPEQAEQATPAPQDGTEQATEAQQPEQEVAAVEEAPAAVEPEVIPTPESRLAPLFELTSQPLEQALPQALSIMQSVYAHDPIAYGLLANAVLQASPEAATELVLSRAGIAPEKISQFNDWIAKGGDALPEPIQFPEFEKTVIALESGEGEQWVKLPNGLEVDIKTPDGLDRYENAKFRYDIDVEKKTGERQRQVEQQKADEQRQQLQQQQAQQALVERVDYYTAGRYALADEIVNKTISALDPSDKLRGDMLKSHARTHIDNHPEVLAIGKQAAAYVREGHGFEKGADGQWKMTGRAAEFAAQQDRVIKRELNALIDQFNKDLLRTNRAELAATGTEPKIPTTAPPVTSNAPQPPNLENAETVQDILAAATAYDRQMAAARR